MTNISEGTQKAEGTQVAHEASMQTSANLSAPAAKIPTETPVKVFVSETKKAINEVKALPKDRRFQVYAGIFLILSVSVLPLLFGPVFGRVAYIFFGIFVPAGMGAFMVLSAYTGKNIVQEIEKNKKQKQPQAHSVEMHEEDKIHETHTID